MAFVEHARYEKYDVVVIGSGFGSLFFVDEFRRKRPRASVLILERGAFHEHHWQIENARNSNIDVATLHRIPDGHKLWAYTVAFGGGMNCWWAQTPRFHPTDFATRTRYGVGVDWPVSYGDLEPYYCAAEEHMAIAGDASMGAVLPRSRPFPLPAHRLTTIDQLMRKAQPDQHFAIATARSSRPLAQRNKCCSSARCNLCPVDAKFTAQNGFRQLYEDPAVDIVLGATVQSLSYVQDSVTAVHYAAAGRMTEARGELVVLGANAIHSPAILLRSGLDDPWLGRGLHEQHSVGYEVFLDGLNNFDGGTVTTGLNYSLYDGDFRAEYGGCLLYFENRWTYGLRAEPSRWRQTLPLWLSIEDLPQYDHRVYLDTDGDVVVSHPSVSDYARRGVQAAADKLARVLRPLPVQDIILRGEIPTASHIQGTLRMGDSAASSVVDKNLVHHRLRNLLIVGSAVIPTSSCANPSLTVAALSMRAADMLTRSSH